MRSALGLLFKEDLRGGRNDAARTMGADVSADAAAHAQEGVEGQLAAGYAKARPGRAQMDAFQRGAAGGFAGLRDAQDDLIGAIRLRHRCGCQHTLLGEERALAVLGSRTFVKLRTVGDAQSRKDAVSLLAQRVILHDVRLGEPALSGSDVHEVCSQVLEGLPASGGVFVFRDFFQ